MLIFIVNCLKEETQKMKRTFSDTPLTLTLSPPKMLKAQESIRLGDVIPNFEADSTHGKCSLYQVIGHNAYGLLFSHPADFTVRFYVKTIHHRSSFLFSNKASIHSQYVLRSWQRQKSTEKGLKR